MKFNWKVTEVTAKDGLITSAKYRCETEESPKVETEGYWYFKEPQLNVPFDNVTEQMVVDWISNEAMRDGKNLITSRLEEQYANLTLKDIVVPPWMPQKFRLDI